MSDDLIVYAPTLTYTESDCLFVIWPKSAYRYGRLRTTEKLPRKLKKAYKKLADRAVEFPDEVLAAVTPESSQ